MKQMMSEKNGFEKIAWGAFFIWWGITAMFKFLPAGSGAIGIGVILLGLNAARYFGGIAVSGFTTALGVLALVSGVVELARATLSLPFEVSFFPILLIVLGVMALLGEFVRAKKSDGAG
jgi:hypothetical protein